MAFPTSAAWGLKPQRHRTHNGHCLFWIQLHLLHSLFFQRHTETFYYLGCLCKQFVSAARYFCCDTRANLTHTQHPKINIVRNNRLSQLRELNQVNSEHSSWFPPPPSGTLSQKANLQRSKSRYIFKTLGTSPPPLFPTSALPSTRLLSKPPRS